MESCELERIVDGLIAANPDDWAKFCAGENKVMGFFVGQVMKATGGKADGKVGERDPEPAARLTCGRRAVLVCSIVVLTAASCSQAGRRSASG